MDNSTRLTLAAILIVVPIFAAIGWYVATRRRRERERLRRRGIKKHGH